VADASSPGASLTGLTPANAPAAPAKRSFWNRLFHVAQATKPASPRHPSSSQEEGRGEGKIQEIIVTAQKRKEDIQNVPISAQVISGQTLAQQNYNTLDDLTKVVPAVPRLSRIFLQ